MNVLMLTNTYAPHIGGVARSVAGFRAALLAMGHEVLVVAPRFAGAPKEEAGVVRVPAIERFHGGDFSIPLPLPARLSQVLESFHPEVVHSHHPFLLGDTALRVAAARGLPVIFTQHALYEHLTSYVPGDSAAMKRSAVDLEVGFCNLCDAVVAPSRSIANLLRRRGVTSRIEVIPTGVDLVAFASADGERGRRAHGIPEDAFVVGHVGRLAPEKNLDLLARAVARFLVSRPDAWFLVVGEGPARASMAAQLAIAGTGERVRFTGTLEEQALADAYGAMEVFAFASRNETQGLVLAEAMACGVPVVALDGPGVRELVVERRNGRLLPGGGDEQELAAALHWAAELPRAEREQLQRAARASAARVAMPRSAGRLLALYESLLRTRPAAPPSRPASWAGARRRLVEEWRIWKNIARAASELARPAAFTRARCLGGAFALLLRGWASSWRVQTEGLAAFDAALAADRPLLAAFWHGHYFPLFPLMRDRRVAVFTSRCFRGEVIADLCRRFGYRGVLLPAGHRQALDVMRQALAAYPAAAVAADGPLGPNHVFKPGVVELAARLGLEVYPVAVAASRQRVASSRWDRREMPRLGSRVALVVGSPLRVVTGPGVATVRDEAQRLGTALQAAQGRAAELLRQPRPEPAFAAGTKRTMPVATLALAVSGQLDDAPRKRGERQPSGVAVDPEQQPLRVAQ